MKTSSLSRALLHCHASRADRRLGLALALVVPALHAQTAGSLDLAFAPDVTGSYVNATAVQPDAKMLLVGSFTEVDGQMRKGIARLEADGSVEPTATFNPATGAGFFYASATAVQADGKIVIGGAFTTVNGQSRNNIARLLANGTVESTATFNPGTGAHGQLFNGAVHGVAVQRDGKILLAGQFTLVNGQSRKGIARLLPNGTVESTATFNSGTGASTGVAGTEAHVYCVAVQADGKILIGGDFATVNGQPLKGIARLLDNGTVESTAAFNPGAGVSGSGGVSTEVDSLAVQADGKILIAGSFTAVNGQPREGFARLLTNGTVESTTTFDPGAGAAGIRSMVLQTDGKILIGGGPPGGGGVFGAGGVARLHADGSVESTATFNPNFGADGYLVTSLALEADGKILVGGSFSSVDGHTRNQVARLDNDAVTESLSLPDPTRVQWLRGGAAPEVEHVTFEVSNDGGVGWNLLGPGTRIPGGWELTGLSVTGSGSLRARGRTSGGSNNGSTGLVESVAVFPVLPSLSITQSGGVLTVSWPFPSAGFGLQQNTDLNTTHWISPSETVTDNGVTQSITISPVPGARFFRLFKP